MPDIGPTSNLAQNNGQAGETDLQHNWVVHFRAEGNFVPQNQITHFYEFLRILKIVKIREFLRIL